MDDETFEKSMMEVQSLQLVLWREVCRHLDLAESAETIAEILKREFSIDGMRIDSVGEHGIDTLFTFPRDLPKSVVACSEGELKELHHWAKEPAFGSVPLEAWRSSLQPTTSNRTPWKLIVGPLVVEGHLRALLTLYCRSEPHAKQLSTHGWLLELLSAAVANEHRLSQLRSLRAAAEADCQRLRTRLGRSVSSDEEIVGAQGGLRLVMERVELVAGLDVPVLILGETGTGKEVISRAIHNRSPRASGPFIRVNCGAIPSELIDSQLFGHEKGSFTGAVELHRGWFERANGGTLFLDEIGELPLAAQVRLLRVLQDHQIERVGGKQPIHVDVRIIAATHRDLSNMVKQREFREDLWYRINVFPVLMPRLQDRIEDIPELAKHFAERAAMRFSLTPCLPSQRDLLILAEYAWPGNVRELGAVIDRAAILGNGKSLEVAKALGLSQPPTYQPFESEEPTYYEVIPESLPVRPAESEWISLEEAMRIHIEKALEITQGRIEGKLGAADLLGINPHTLRARMRKMQIDWSVFRRD